MTATQDAPLPEASPISFLAAARLSKSAAQRVNVGGPVVNVAGTTAYGLKALEANIATLAATGEGSRNHALNTAAFNLGQLVGDVDADTAVAALSDVARRIGLDEAEIVATIASGMRDGAANAKAAPPMPTYDLTPFVPPTAASGPQADGVAAPASDPGDPDPMHAAKVGVEVRALRARHEAKVIFAAELAAAPNEPAPILLGDFLAVADDPVTYRVDRLWPAGGRVVFAAQYKAGKSTAVENLLRSLADGDPFLGHFAVTPAAGRVVIIDNELSEPMLRRWLRDQGIVNVDRVAVVPLRGRVGTFNIIDPACRARWVAHLRGVGADVVLFDCLRPVLDALGLSEDKEAGRFLVAFDALLAEAGVREAVVVHHMGHAGERSRGDTRLRDWPDVEWTLVRAKAAEGADADPSGPRYFKAYGRDVDQPEGLLEYDPATRRTTWAGGNRHDTATDHLIPEILEYLAVHPRTSQRGVEQGLAPQPRDAVRAALKRAIVAGQVITEAGPNRATFHSLGDPSPPVR